MTAFHSRFNCLLVHMCDGQRNYYFEHEAMVLLQLESPAKQVVNRSHQQVPHSIAEYTQAFFSTLCNTPKLLHRDAILT